MGGQFNFFGLTPIAELLEKAGISGAALEALEIVSVTTVVERAAEWREIALRPPQGMRQEWTAVRRLSAGIADFGEFLRGFRNKILPDGTLDDKASPALASIRREIEKQKRGIQESLRGHLRRLAEGGAVQDELITIRGERFVIPVKTEQKRRVQGVVHGASSSGQTVFVEPLETIEQNNELVRLLEDEQAEVRRILLEMTRWIGERAEEIAAALGDIWRRVELQFAKAGFAEEYDCVAPELVAGDSRLILRDARHPLLERNLKSKSKSKSKAPLLAKDARNGAPGAEEQSSEAKATCVGQECPTHAGYSGDHRTGRGAAGADYYWPQHGRKNCRAEDCGVAGADGAGGGSGSGGADGSAGV